MLNRAFFCFSVLITTTFVPSLRLHAEENDLHEKLTAFSRTFGLVRYFHPSEQAVLVDWEKMAYYGTEQALASKAGESTQQLLTKIFAPIVIELEFYQGVEKDRPETKTVAADEILAWQHKGIGMNQQSLYKSIRLNRTTTVAAPASPFGNLMQNIDPTSLRGKKIRYLFEAKVEEGKCKLQGWYRVDRANGKTGLFENMGDRPITNKKWKEYELTGVVDDDAKSMTFGVMFFGNGSASVDNVRLEQQTDNGWKNVPIPNADFENGKWKPKQWFLSGNGYSLESNSDDSSAGKKSARISRGTTTSYSKPMFDKIPKLGEVADVKIASNLRVRMPIALRIDQNYKKGENTNTDELIAAIAETKTNNSDQTVASIANVVLLWNVFQHFYPYFEQVETDWDATLATGMSNAIVADSRKKATENLQWIVAQLHDGHGMLIDVEAYKDLQSAPVNFAWVENELIVTASDQDEFQVGDVVKTVDGLSAADYLAAKEKLISGSPQWKRHRSTQQFSMGSNPRSMTLKRDGTKHEVKLIFKGRSQATVDKGEICRILVDDAKDENDIWFIDMGRAEPKHVDDKLELLAKAKGIVLDFRGYPRGTQYLFQHMTDEHMQSQKWQVPNQVRPDRVDMKEIETMGRWEMPPRKPRFQGKMVFITNGSAISYAESCMAIVANYKLGEIIGSRTAGANGNINPFGLPGGYRVSWTGMRVMNHDDSQHHVNGVQPTIPMEPTIENIREGKDELLEKAIELISTS